MFQVVITILCENKCSQIRSQKPRSFKNKRGQAILSGWRKPIKGNKIRFKVTIRRDGMMRLFVMFFVVSVVSCENKTLCTTDYPTYKRAAVENLNEYVKANIKSVDDSYQGEAYDIEGKKYPTDKIREAPKEGFPEGVRRECFTSVFHIED